VDEKRKCAGGDGIGRHSGLKNHPEFQAFITTNISQTTLCQFEGSEKCKILCQIDVTKLS